MKRTLRLLSVTAVVSLALALTARAQIKVTEQESADKSTSRTEVARTTGDRTAVPLVMEIKETKLDANTTRRDSVTQVRLSDGAYLESQRSTSVTRKLSANVTETSREIVEKDRQGADHLNRRETERVTQTADGKQRSLSAFRRNSSGQLILDREVTTFTSKKPDGTTSTVQTEKQVDVNGKLVPKQETEEVVTLGSPTEKRITTSTKLYDRFGNAAAVEETATVRTEGNATTTERIISKPRAGSLAVTARIVTTEKRGADGSVQRETIEHGESLDSIYRPAPTGELQPKRKIVESEARKPDGTTVLQREVFRRDVNGDWKPVTYSTDLPDASDGKPAGY